MRGPGASPLSESRSTAPLIRRCAPPSPARGEGEPSIQGQITRGEALQSASRRLADAAVPEPLVDARLLLCAAAVIDRAALLRDPDLPVGAAAERFEAGLRRRLNREPVSRILGHREFWGLAFEVTADVLDPRPDTETLVAAALARLGASRTRAWRVLDLGTGSGAILSALLSELPEAQGWAVDRSFEACAVARRNLARHGLGARSLVLKGDWASGLRRQSFDLVLSNPPYVASSAIGGLEPEVREHDPGLALDGGIDGLEAYRAIAAYLPDLLAPRGHVMLEVGMGQAGEVARLLRKAGLAGIETARDLAGIERVVIGSRGE